MKARLLLGGALALCAAAIAPAPASAQVLSGEQCFWFGGDQPGGINIAYPDEGAKYVVGGLLIPPGGEVVLRGRFPNARYMSFNIYDPLMRPTDGLADVRIAPDSGSVNPFLPGANRSDPNRKYTVRIVSGVPPDPAQRPPNTLYLSSFGAPALLGAIIYRVYVPDQGRDALGDGGYPNVFFRSAAGTETPAPHFCQGGAAIRGCSTS